MATSTAIPATPLTRTKSTTRPSIKQSFGLASVSKAFSDAIHKESHSSSRAPKNVPPPVVEVSVTQNPKDASRRLSNLGPRPSIGSRPPSAVPSLREKLEFPAAPAGSISVSRPSTSRPPQPQKLASAPSEDSTRTSDSSAETKRMTRSRTAALSSHVVAPMAPATEKVSSGLPKLRLRKDTGALRPSAGKISPPRVAVRRKLSMSDDEDDSNESRDSLNADAKRSRAISPLPRRPVVQVKLTGRTITPPGQVNKLSMPSSFHLPRTQSPSSRSPSKTLKKAPPPSINTGPSISRPPSAASVRSMSAKPLHAQVPVAAAKERSIRGSFFGRSSASTKPSVPAPVSSNTPAVRHPAQPPRSESPQKQPVKPLEKPRKSSVSSYRSDATATPAVGRAFAGDISVDSVNVEMLLTSTQSENVMATPTAAPVLVQALSDAPQTPIRTDPLVNSGFLFTPTLSSSLLLRQPPQSSPNDRMSMTLDQLAASGMNSLGEGEIEGLLADITAPPGMMSPTPSHMTFADAGPFSFAIADIALPDKTPSPGPRRLFGESAPGLAAVPSVREDYQGTMLRLQIAQAEDLAKSRLSAMQALEEQMHDMKERYAREQQGLLEKVTRLEGELNANLEERQVADNRHAERMMLLEEQVRHTGTIREEAVAAAVNSVKQAARKQQAVALEHHSKRSIAATTANRAVGRWAVVYEVADAELAFIESNKATLALLLAEVNARLAQLQVS